MRELFERAWASTLRIETALGNEIADLCLIGMFALCAIVLISLAWMH